MATPLSHRHLTVKCRSYIDFAKEHSFFSLTYEQYEIKGTVALQLSILNLRYSNYCLIILLSTDWIRSVFIHLRPCDELKVLRKFKNIRQMGEYFVIWV